MIVIPMAGLSRRFTIAGYRLPKYMLELDGRSVFYHAIESFSSLFHSVPFLFVARPISGTEEFIQSECARLGISDPRIVILSEETAGQAETVERGITAIKTSQMEPLTIFNIDTFRRGFQFPAANWFPDSDGYLEVFKGAGANWSYVCPAEYDSSPLVTRTAEKQPISDLCCNGLYHFAKASDFQLALDMERQAPQSAELYIAPLYNHLISAGRKIHYNLIPKDLISFCGVPDEYEAMRSRNRI